MQNNGCLRALMVWRWLQCARRWGAAKLADKAIGMSLVQDLARLPRVSQPQAGRRPRAQSLIWPVELNRRQRHRTRGASLADQFQQPPVPLIAATVVVTS